METGVRQAGNSLHCVRQCFALARVLVTLFVKGQQIGEQSNVVQITYATQGQNTVVAQFGVTGRQLSVNAIADPLSRRAEAPMRPLGLIRRALGRRMRDHSSHDRGHTIVRL